MAESEIKAVPVPLYSKISIRNPSLGFPTNGTTGWNDAFSSNGWLETAATAGDDGSLFVKRPAFSALNSSILASGPGRGFVIMGPTQAIYAVIGSYLYLFTVSGSGGTVGPLGTSTGNVYSVTMPTGLGVSAGAVFQDGTYIYGLSNFGTPIFNTYRQWVSYTATFSGTTVTIPGTSISYYVNDPVVFTTTGTLPSPLVSGNTYYIVSVGGVNTFSISASPGGTAITFSGAGTGTHTMTRQGFDYASTTALGTFFAPGIVELDNVVYVAVGNRVYNSDPLTNQQLAYPGQAANFSPNNYITSSSDYGSIVGITSYLNYIVAFHQNTVDFFYNAGNPTGPANLGSILSPYASARVTVGCVNGATIANGPNTVFWIGSNNGSGLSAYMFNGLTPQQISNPYVDRFLDADGCTTAFCWYQQVFGHKLYFVNLFNQNVTLVYDMTVQDWYIWTYYNSITNGVLPITAATGLNVTIYGYLTLSQTNGWVYSMNKNVYNDFFNSSQTSIYFSSQTDRLDFGTNQPKFFGRWELVCDQTPLSDAVAIYTSDNDAQTWQGPRLVDPSLTRPRLYQNGSSSDRVWQVIYLGNQAMRFDNFEVDVSANR